MEQSAHLPASPDRELEVIRGDTALREHLDQRSPGRPNILC